MAVAQSPDQGVFLLQTEGENGETNMYIGTPAGPESLLVISSPEEEVLRDADGLVSIRGLETLAENVELVEQTDYSVTAGGAGLNLILVKVAFEDGRSLIQSKQSYEALADDTDVTVLTWRDALDAEGAPRRSTSRQVVMAGDSAGFVLNGVTSSAIRSPLELGGFVFDGCGNLTAVAGRETSSGSSKLVPIDTVSGVVAANASGKAFELAEMCEASKGESKAKVRAEAALAESEQKAAEHAAESERLAQKAEAAEQKLAELRETNARREAIDLAVKELQGIKDAQTANDETGKEIAIQLAESRGLIDGIPVPPEPGIWEQYGKWILAVVAGLVVLAAGFIVWLFLRSRRLKRDLGVARDENRDMEDAKVAAEVRWNDCILENEQGLTVKLPGVKLPKAKGGVTVGRSREEADVVIDRDDISRTHACFEADEETVQIKDLGSTNKTRVNGSVLEKNVPRKIYEGDKIAFGINEFVFKIVRRS